MITATDKLLDPTLVPVKDKVRAGERLGFDDGLALYRTRDIFTLGQLASIVRERKHGRHAFTTSTAT